jgi:hypothetical protein
MADDVDEILRRVRLPRPPSAPRKGIHWLTMADSRRAQQLARRQLETLGTVARITGQIR